jgi:hypothetical protein
MSDVTNDEQVEVQQIVVLYRSILEGKSKKNLCSTKGECMVRWFNYGVVFIFFHGIFCLNGCGDKCMFQFVN